jgi:hypothetical protein
MTLHYKQKDIFAIALIGQDFLVDGATLLVWVYHSSHHRSRLL